MSQQKVKKLIKNMKMQQKAREEVKRRLQASEEARLQEQQEKHKQMQLQIEQNTTNAKEEKMKKKIW